jgi:hypothetical protein
MRELKMPNWEIEFTGIVLAVTIVVIAMRIALSKQDIDVGNLKKMVTGRFKKNDKE